MSPAMLDLPKPLERLGRGGLSDAQADELLATLSELEGRLRRFACASSSPRRRGRRPQRR